MLNGFKDYLLGLGKSENTAAAYLRDVKLFLDWCRDSFGDEPKLLHRANVLEYISYMRNVSTVEKKDVEAFRQRLLESGSKRDFCIVTLYAYSGIRRSECVNLKLSQIDLAAKEICIVGKGDKHRLVYLNDKTVHAIREYLKVRDSDSPYLFVSRQSGKLNPSRINQIFNQYSDVITPKTLRHYFCSNALESGYSIHEVANQAGHSNVQTTLIYSNPTAKEMKEKANRL